MNIETSAAFENWAMLLSGVLLHSLWQGAIIVMLVAVMVRWVKCSAALRSSVYMIGLIGIVISFLSTGLLIRQPSSATFGASEIAGRSIDSVAIVAADRRSENSTRTPALNFTENDQSANVIEASPKRWVVLARFIAGFYLLGVLLMAGRLFCGVTGSRRLRSKAERIKDRSVLQMVERMSDAIMLRVRPPVVAFSSEVVTPAVVGVLRPMILLPVGLLSSIPQEQVEAIIAHELAHLRRFDHIGLLVQRFVETVAFYHPAVWWLSRKLADAREESCDEIVLSCGCDRADYAESLLTMNEWARGALTSDHGRLALGVAGRKQVLRKRLLRILGVMPAPARRHRFSCDVGLVGALATLLICGVVGVPFLVKAQEGGGVAPIGAELSPKPDVRIPGLHPVEREVIEKIERLVRKSRALAKTEDEQGSKDSERPPSVDLLYKAIELLEIYCEESSHPELLRLHRTVNLLAGRPGSAEEFQAWIVPSQHLRRATELADKGQWQAAKVDYLKAFDTRPEKAGWRDYGYL
ncbi:MAG: beta-lactamase regulating signal transducer with metallopeptidase domain, partial [Verrucomicrobiales bacterium]